MTPRKYVTCRAVMAPRKYVTRRPCLGRCAPPCLSNSLARWKVNRTPSVRSRHGQPRITITLGVFRVSGSQVLIFICKSYSQCHVSVFAKNPRFEDPDRDFGLSSGRAAGPWHHMRAPVSLREISTEPPHTILAHEPRLYNILNQFLVLVLVRLSTLATDVGCVVESFLPLFPHSLPRFHRAKFKPRLSGEFTPT